MAYLTQYSGSVPVIKFNIDQSVLTIGQDINMDICVPEEGISDNHCALEAVKNNDSYQFIIKSRKYEAPIVVNGETVSVTELHDGDWIVIGEIEFQFTDDGIYDIKQVENPYADSAEITSAQQVNKLSTSSEIFELSQGKQVEAEPMAGDSMKDAQQFSRRLNFF